MLFLEDVARQIGRQPLLIPTSDITALFVAENAEILAREYLFSTPRVEMVRCLVNKQQTFDLCRKLRIPTAETASPQSREEVMNFARNREFSRRCEGRMRRISWEKRKAAAGRNRGWRERVASKSST